ncbi:SDR family NAD(P)-dependent oxidoreductase [Maribacter hydrothermalis]|uniref:Short-chain dehydrogenase n=1 Tax=Maribacter hydrothermalis TaxID=1836467 RepID=A0A1B7Z113_9FLAO|nr:SDR family oxidoreductase [Maribacter hydrothermalis]APQ18062.1 short-chain dehydrogenase [Maribacter hydrothermalis]OBR36407.1 short-chain dehydrogenase [Maribacter hydrothermalis]
MQLEGKYVLITGGTRGIGKCMIQELVKGGVSKIAVIARDKQNLKQLAQEFEGVKFIKIAGDVANIEVLRDAVALIEDKWGHLDILINNAGIVSAGPLEDIQDEDLYDQVAINLTAVLLLTKYCIPLLKASKEAAILNISSGLGLIGKPFYAVYGSTKAGIRQFSDSMRRELAPFNISVTCAFPTATDTDMMQKFKGREMDSPEFVAERSIAGLLNKESQVIFGGEERLNENAMNFNAPDELDKIIAESYEERKTASIDHKAV